MGYRELTGYTVKITGEGTASGRLAVTEDHENRGGILHGGAIATLCDSAMGRAVRTKVDTDMRTATATMTVNYLASAHPGDVVCVEASVIKAGRTTIVVEAEVCRESDGKPIARAVATFIQSSRR
ncbi:PaaI family thioesterase [Cumulibacter manganitolerans]|uniref:PaaI family thioesterase n=1 Tax=Cumulibacter manganitolerans TaxID=1884992 RepID=UPI0018864ACB|nr:PaaI family thioesterase [Cumulibacter manganitolerans]